MGEIATAVESVAASRIATREKCAAFGEIRAAALADRLEFEGVPLARWAPDDTKEVTRGGEAVEFDYGDGRKVGILALERSDEGWIRAEIGLILDGKRLPFDNPFKLVMPPSLVLDPTGDIVQEYRRLTGEVVTRRYREDPLAALRETIGEYCRADHQFVLAGRALEKGGPQLGSYTIYAGAAGGWLESSSGSYSSARAGSSLRAETDNDVVYAGQYSGFGAVQAFALFNLTSVTGTASVATMACYGADDSSTTDFTMEIRSHAWGPSLTTDDWVAGADLGGKTLLASRSTSGYTTSGYNTFTSQSALLTQVDLHGSLEVLVCSAEQTNNSQPTNNEYVGFYGAAQSGTSQDPKIDITTIDAGGAKLAMAGYRRRRS